MSFVSSYSRKASRSGWKNGRTTCPSKALVPARPKYNGGVERGNRTFREEFYACRDLIADSIGAMRFDLRKAVEKYNTFRPHHALKGKTPMEYLRITQVEAAWVSKDLNLYSASNLIHVLISLTAVDREVSFVFENWKCDVSMKASMSSLANPSNSFNWEGNGR